MSEVNLAVYPTETPTEGYEYLKTSSVRIGTGLPYNEDWETSCAIAQSSAVYAPFNAIDFYYQGGYNQAEYVEHYRKSLQKTALWAFRGMSMGTSQYTNSGSQSDMDFWHTMALRRKGGNDPTSGLLKDYGLWGSSDNPGTWGSLRANYSPNSYRLLTGIDLKKILGVIYVAIADSSGNLYYCSLKDYETNYSAQTVQSAFMIFYIQKPSVLNNFDICAPIDLTPRKFAYFKQVTGYNQGELANVTDEFVDFYPPYEIFAGLNKKSSSLNYTTYQQMSSPFLAPLVGCLKRGTFFGRSFSQGNWSAHCFPVFGANSDMYERYAISSEKYTTKLTARGIELLRNVAATYGLPFTDDYIADISDIYSGNKTTYMPIANDGGLFNGVYEVLTTNGTENPNLSPENYNMWNGGVDAPFNDREYDPDAPESTSEIELTTPTLTAIDSFNNSYIINKDNVKTIAQALWAGGQSLIDQVLDSWQIFGEDPINGIVNLMLFPFDVKEKAQATTQVPVFIGHYTPFNAYKLEQNANAHYNLGTFKWMPKFGDSFLDYRPYTEAELYIPYFGTIQLPNEHFLGKYISIELIVDYVTGAATCVIYVTEEGKKHPVIYKNATLGIQVPISGMRAQGRLDSFLNAGMQIIGAGTKIGSGVAGVKGGDIVGGITNILSGLTDITSPNFEPSTMFQEAGASSPECSIYLPMKPYIIMYYPKLLELDNYGHLIGHATMQEGRINDFSGFSVFSNIDMSGLNATEEEKNKIRALLESGVYV